MGKITQSKIVELVTSYYLTSGDFNGLPASALCREVGVPWNSIIPLVEKLVLHGRIGVISSSAEMNPHIIRTGFLTKDEQLNQLNDNDKHHICLYPLEKHLARIVDPTDYAGKPYSLKLALGAAQLEIVFFDLLVLEQYRNDPRYSYECDEIGGKVVAKYEYSQSTGMPDKDKVLLQSFGLAFDDELNRAVGAFVCNLAKLTPEHQQIWKARELQGNWRIHPDFYGSQVLGRWGQHISIFKAFLLEQHIMNRMAAAMGRDPLFRMDHGEYCELKPRQFGYIIRPTAAEFASFVHLLDKLLSENINKMFFKKDIPLEEEKARDDGRIELIRIGTISLLDKWIRKHFKPIDWESWEFAISVFKKVRDMRQKPAHSINEDAFSQQYVQEQRELMKDAYSAIRILRSAIETHPAVRSTNIPIP